MRPGPIGKIASRALLAAGWAALVVGGCAQEPTPQPLRSLERSGRSAYLCLLEPGHPGGAARPIEECRTPLLDVTSLDQFRDDAGNPIPHLYALVTQTTRGEVALIDLSLKSLDGGNDQAVIDQDDRVPGANFLPVGAQPTDIVATAGGTATFVSVAEVGRQGIFAIPTSTTGATTSSLRPTSTRVRPALSSWPACSLPEAPGNMVLMTGSPEEDSCNASYAADTSHPNGDLSQEKLGRQKLLVTLPNLGGIAVIDAQAVLDNYSSSGQTQLDTGTFESCPIDAWLPLVAKVPAPAPPPQPGGRTDCVNPEPAAVGTAKEFVPRPAGLALVDRQLFIADLQAPVVHSIDLHDVCDPVERAPLVTSSDEDPTRVVFTSKLAVTPGLTVDLKRFLYAVDDQDGSVMVFDVSDGPHDTAPLRRPHPEYTPFSPGDRIRFSAPIRDVAIVQRDVPELNPLTGVAQVGVFCDPDPGHSCPLATDPKSPVKHCDVGALYRSRNNFDTGAGPEKLRGTFAFLVLTSGAVAIIDIEDYDAPCRGPLAPSALSGCTDCLPLTTTCYNLDTECCGVGCDASSTCSKPAFPLTTDQLTGEVSCNVVMPHTPRSSVIEITSDDVGRHQPGLQTFPLLFDDAGTLIPAQDDASPRLRAPRRPTGFSGKQSLAVAGKVITADSPENPKLDPDTGVVDDTDGSKHALTMNLEDPRSQTADQPWTATFEGPLPGFTTKRAEFYTGTAKAHGFYDADSRFCDNGVLSESAWKEILGPEAEAQAPLLADRLSITLSLVDEKDHYWEDPSRACTFQECKSTFGTPEVPTPNRDLRITEAFQDHVEIADPTAVALDTVKCCFPFLVSFDVRGGNQWVVIGDNTGFLHHVIADPETGVCRNSCAPTEARLNGRARMAPGATNVDHGDPFAFQNPMFEFVITECTKLDATSKCPPLKAGLRRGSQFGWVTQGSFNPLIVSLSGDTKDVQPQAIATTPTGRLAITDGSLEGLMLVDPGSLGTVTRYQ